MSQKQKFHNTKYINQLEGIHMIRWLKSKLGIFNLEEKLFRLQRTVDKKNTTIAQLKQELIKKDKQVQFLYVLVKKLQKEGANTQKEVQQLHENVSSYDKLWAQQIAKEKSFATDDQKETTHEQEESTAFNVGIESPPKEESQESQISSKIVHEEPPHQTSAEETSPDAKEADTSSETTTIEPLSFVALDVETANTNPASICSIGIVEVQNGTIHNSEHFFIRPKRLVFNPRNVEIHGITEEDVKNHPKLDELWDTLKNYIDGKKIVAHNASFDMAAIRRALDEYQLTYPDCDYICTKNLSKKYLPDAENYKLSTLSQMYDIELQHHDALSDAKACAKLAIEFCAESNMSCITELSEELNVEVKEIRADDERYSVLNPRKNKFGEYVRISDIQANVEKVDKNHIYFGKKFCFTGTLKSMERNDAMQAVVDIGGSVTKSMGKNVHYLVIGEDGEGTSKHKAALKLKKENHDVTIISEKPFLQNINK